MEICPTHFTLPATKNLRPDGSAARSLSVLMSRRGPDGIGPTNNYNCQLGVWMKANHSFDKLGKALFILTSLSFLLQLVWRTPTSSSPSWLALVLLCLISSPPWRELWRVWDCFCRDWERWGGSCVRPSLVSSSPSCSRDKGHSSPTRVWRWRCHWTCPAATIGWRHHGLLGPGLN